MIRRPSRWAGSSAAKESSISTMSATSRVTALPLRIATPTWARLERAGVVDAVADHGDVAALPAQRRDDALLLLGRDPAEHGRAGDQPVELGVVEPVERGAGHRRRRRRARPGVASAATVRGSSPERTLSATPSPRRSGRSSRRPRGAARRRARRGRPAPARAARGGRRASRSAASGRRPGRARARAGPRAVRSADRVGRGTGRAGGARGRPGRRAPRRPSSVAQARTSAATR